MHTGNLEVIEKSNGKLYHKTITGSDQELITQGTTGVTLVSNSFLGIVISWHII